MTERVYEDDVLDESPEVQRKREMQRQARELRFELESEHGAGNVVVLMAPDGQLIAIRGAEQGNHDRWLDKMSSDTESRSTAMRELALSAIVRPAERDARKALLKRYPALTTTVVTRSLELAGGKVEELGND